MAIRLRRGNNSDLDTSKLLGGEIAITDSPTRVVGKTNAGSDFELITKGGVASDAFGKVKVGASEIEATGSDTLELEAGTGITLTPNTTNKKVTITSGADQTYNASSANAQSGTAVAGAIADKVDKVTGKGLSTNDYTDNDKTALQTTIPLEISQLQGSMLTKVNRSEIYSQPTFTVTGEALVYTPGSLPS